MEYRFRQLKRQGRAISPAGMGLSAHKLVWTSDLQNCEGISVSCLPVDGLVVT